MPYIKKDLRLTLDKPVIELILKISTPGELNYVITKLVTEYLKNESESYLVYNEIIGCLECAKQEFYRRAIVPYEEKKRKENGDVF